MSTLPDISTGGVGYIAYWNAINSGGVGSINASDALSDSNIQSYTLYDNGFTAQYSSVTGRTITVRVKQDGWFVAYMDRTNNFTQSSSSKVRGYWDVMNDWSSSGSNINTFPNNTLERSINSLQSQLSNSGSITYNSSDVGLYNYEYTSATTSTEFSSFTSASGTQTETSGLIYTSNTSIHYAIASGDSGTYSNTNTTSHGDYSFNGSTVTSTPSSGYSGQYYYGSVNLLSNNLIPNPQTEYDASLVYPSKGTVLTMWS